MRNLLHTIIAVIFIGLTCISQLAYADDFANYTQFYILSDRSYSSDEQAQVRLETNDLHTVHENAGIEMAIYRVANPIDFLKKQKNLHRINTKAQVAKPGIWNAIVAIWDDVARRARHLVRQHFSDEARTTTVDVAPELHRQNNNKTHYRAHNSAYKPLKGYEMVARFRYPLQFGNDVKPAKAVLDGANVEGNITQNGQLAEAPPSQSFSNGNVYVPLGKLPSGLYIVEAMLGQQRAVTMVFVGDTVAVTKSSDAGLFVWAVNRTTGEPVANVETHWSDGVGILATDKTNAQGWVQLNHQSPEQTYLFAQDQAGGILISENYFYHSEIYNAKVYATTDKPLYRPGDVVNIKVLGREFVDAQISKPLANATMQISVFDPNGLPVAKSQLTFDAVSGGDTAFTLPANSHSGGYEIQIDYEGEPYSAAFRVAHFQKPHFQINLNVDKDELKIDNKIPVHLQLRYPDGKPVQQATVEVDLKAQALSIVDGDLAYSGKFPIKLSSKQYKTDGNGNLKLDLPEAKQASRYIISVLATDGAAYRVRHTQELLIERAESHWQVKALNRFTAPHQSVKFALNRANAASELNAASTPAKWQWVRLEDQSKAEGAISGNINKGLTVKFEQSGSYTLSVLNKEGSILGATSHWVSGPDLVVPVGHIEVVWDKTAYQIGDTATALVSFSEPVEQALLTLERDKVEQASLLNKPQAWLKTKKVAAQQWQVSVPVEEHFFPNMTFSVAYVKDNEFVFENAGILVASPKIKVKVSADKKQYLPGDTVKLSIDTLLASPGKSGQDKAVSAQVSLSVVDEMIYVLQPEIAPNIVDFFYHPRRNNVRTQYSQSFIGYDVSTNQLGVAPQSHQVQQRVTKVLERPRRDDVDTALWQPLIQTNAQGHAEISFKMPDVLTRWRITARAMSQDGVVGQSTSNILSDKDFYIKWTSPDWLRQQDQAESNIAIFNQTKEKQQLKLMVSGALSLSQNVTLDPGINFVKIPRKGSQFGDVKLTLSKENKVYDQLMVSLNSMPSKWLSHHSQLRSPQDGVLPLTLPKDARNISVSLLDKPNAAFYRVVDDLTDQPYGCAEQTASRLIPLALVYQALPAGDARKQLIEPQLYTHRMRLASMAGPEAHFGWWGANMATDSFLTTYAYYADWTTANALNLDLPDDHWQSLLPLYSESGVQQSPWQRALMLDWMSQIGLPVNSLVTALANELTTDQQYKKTQYHQHDSRVLTAASAETHQLAILLTNKLLKSPVSGFDQKVMQAVEQVKMEESVLAQALLQITGHQINDTSYLLSQMSREHATIDRALVLTWLYNSLKQQSHDADNSMISPELKQPWQRHVSKTNSAVYVWPQQDASTTLPAQIATPFNAVVKYDSEQSLPANSSYGKLKRKLYRLEKQGDGKFKQHEVSDNIVTTEALYLDVISIEPSSQLRYMVVDAALPAGAMVEPSTWGIKVADESLPKAHYQALLGQYAIPIGDINKPVEIKHLIRFSQKGQYQFPAARAYNMYQANKQLVEENPRQHIQVK